MKDKQKFRTYKNEDGEVYVRCSDLLKLMPRLRDIYTSDGAIKVIDGFELMITDLINGHDDAADG